MNRGWKVQMNRQGKLYLCLLVLIGSRGPVCDWTILSPSSLLAVTLHKLSLSPPLSGLTITSLFHLQLHSPLCRLYVCMWARTGSKLRTRQDSNWKEILSLCLACHFLAHLIYFSRQCFLLNNITATRTHHTKTTAYTPTETQSQSHAVASCQSGQMSQP